MNHIDQLGRTIRVDQTPKRIVSLVPSITELLYDLGIGDRVVGRTKFCIHPKGQVQDAAKIGGTKNVNIDRVIALKPDLIIANKEENERGQIEGLSKQFPVWISEITTFSEGLDMIHRLGEIVERQEEANKIVKESQTLMKKIGAKKKRKTVYLIWQKPYMTIGKDTYIHDLLAHTGFENVFGDQTRYPTFTLEELQERQPDIILLSSEPFPFKQKHIDELQEVLPEIPIQLVDGEAFSWYGTRFLKTYDYLNNL